MTFNIYKTKIGAIGLEEKEGFIVRVYFEKELTQISNRAIEDGPSLAESDLLKEANRQLTAYLEGGLTEFDLPLNPIGTEFQKQVWHQLTQIPYGTTESYKGVAEAIGNPKACRAVGLANNRNPIPIFIPCHRVIGASGDLVGFGGGLDIKKRLLDIEKGQ